MSYSCQFCGDIEEHEVLLRCTSCNEQDVVRGALGSECKSCGATGTQFTAICPTCGSDELEK